MPANLTPEYHRAEQRFREARTPEEKLDALEEMLRVVPKHKGTDGLQADLKARIAKLKKQPGTKGGRSTFTHMVPREGAGQVVLVGPPNAGKSALVRALTHAEPEVADYPFTTREALPGMMAFENVAIQLVDLPPVSEQHYEPWVFDMVRRADLAWLVVDGALALEGLEATLRLVTDRHLDLVPAVAPSMPPIPDPTRSSRRALLVLTGADKAGMADSLDTIDELLERRWPMIAVSSVTGTGLDDLRRRTFEALEIVRVFTKQPGKPADRRAPYTLPRGSTVADLAARIHKDVQSQMTFARVWGATSFPGQTVQRDHVLVDLDVVEIHT